jgi:signal transduction histidine kinase
MDQEAPETRQFRARSQEGNQRTAPERPPADCFNSLPAAIFSPMNDSERLSRLRHDLSNPLSALLAETQLLLLNESKIDPETLTALREIEALAIRMRTMLREL